MMVMMVTTGMTMITVMERKMVNRDTDDRDDRADGDKGDSEMMTDNNSSISPSLIILCVPGTGLKVLYASPHLIPTIFL